jgi:leader peptidase (prepilin peptidase) / N-methyltransferase
MDKPAVILILVFVFGAIVGSFLNVCIYRIPRGKSIVRPGSHCPACGKQISFFDNVPFLSYLILRGKCRQCKATISPRYFVVELLTALLFTALYFVFGLSLELPVNMAFVSLLIIISFIDFDLKIIPDVLSIGGAILGMALSFFRPAVSYKEAFFGILLGGGILFVIAISYQFFAKREGMGGGDIKLLAMIGAFCGIWGVVFTLVFGALAGTVVGIPLMLIKGEGTKYALPFGPFLSLGALAYILVGDSLIYGYIRLVSGG